MTRHLHLILPALLMAAAATAAPTDKKPLDHGAYDSWQSVQDVTISDDGRIVSYAVNPQDGDGTLYFKELKTGRLVEIARGHSASMAYDGTWAVCRIKQPYDTLRQAKIKKKKGPDAPKDSVAFIDLRTFEVTGYAGATSLTAPRQGTPSFAYGIEGKGGKSLVLAVPGQAPDTLKGVSKGGFDPSGSRFAAVFQKDKKDSLSSDRVVLYRLAAGDSIIVSEGKALYGKPVFNESGDRFAFTASADTNSTGSRHCSIFLGDDNGAREIVPQDFSDGFPQGWCITEKCPLTFSRLSSRLIIGLSEFVPQKDTTLYDFETPSLDIWNYDIYMTPPFQKASAARLADATLDAVVNLDAKAGQVIVISRNISERVSYFDGAEGGFAMVVDREPYLIQSTWDSNDKCDVRFVDLGSGIQKTVVTGLCSTPTLSPDGRHFLWYDTDDLGWHSYRVEDGAVINLTAGIGGVFHDTEDDHPGPKPNTDRPHWIEGCDTFLLADEYDIFHISADGGKAVNLTKGAGRADKVRYRYVRLDRDKTSPALRRLGVSTLIGKKETVYLNVHDRVSKQNGYATLNVSKPGLRSSFTAPYGYSSACRSESGVIAYRKGDFRHSSDLHTTADNWKTEQKHTAINPQQDSYVWGDARLVHWTAYDGTPLDGILITPENLDTSAKYPMISYFYEKYSDNIYSYFPPAPSRSTVNFPYFASNGYVVFIPDIVYEVGHPGESAYNCICAGVEAMCEQFPFIDRSKVGIQGQSWGGYQTAYLVTRTDMFAAAGAGAPVGNMTSAYGGIRWESGMVRAMQYEMGQSRIGTSLWAPGGLDLYIENSPIFHTEHVTTPVLIMHNDNDGAVPWYQGIEFFMALRRFGHPAWLLEYNNEAHNLRERRNCKDLSIRLQQFFDHYLKGEPAPAWMKTGVPVSRKGQYFGYEK